MGFLIIQCIVYEKIVYRHTYIDEIENAVKKSKVTRPKAKLLNQDFNCFGYFIIVFITIKLNFCVIFALFVS